MSAKPNPLPELQAGDVLLYFTKTSLVDWLIGLRTWSMQTAHVEVYAGAGLSYASRNGIGVGRFPFRREGLTFILRPESRFNTDSALTFFNSSSGTPYGWTDLLQFFSIRIKTKGLICSQFADLLLGSGGVIAFNRDYFAGTISPRDFLITPALNKIWKGN